MPIVSEITEMAVSQKQSFPSFASVISILSILLYCAGFLRVELELNKQKRRISHLENVAEIKPPSLDPNIVKLIKNVPSKLRLVIHLEVTTTNFKSTEACLVPTEMYNRTFINRSDWEGGEGFPK